MKKNPIKYYSQDLMHRKMLSCLFFTCGHHFPLCKKSLLHIASGSDMIFSWHETVIHSPFGCTVSMIPIGVLCGLKFTLMMHKCHILIQRAFQGHDDIYSYWFLSLEHFQVQATHLTSPCLKSLWWF